MTEKRFVLIDIGFVYDNDELIGMKKIVELLNELHEENQELKRLVKATVEDYTDLKQSFDLIDKENEQLKKQIGNLEHTRNFCAECCERLEKENKQLESEIREVRGAYEQLWMYKYK